MLEVVSAFVRGEGVEALADPCPEVVERPFSCLSEERRELGEGELDGVEVRGVRRQEEKVRAACLDEAADVGPLVAAQIVEDALITSFPYTLAFRLPLSNKGRPHNAQCPLWVISRPFSTAVRMSAFGGKADVIQGVAVCPLIAISGHSSIPLPASEQFP